MDIGDEYKDEFMNEFKKNLPQKTFLPFYTPHNTVAIYTVLTILLKMRDQIGLEAMLEYIEKYISIIDKKHSRLKFAVDEALLIVSVNKIYREARNDDRK